MLGWRRFLILKFYERNAKAPGRLGRPVPSFDAGHPDKASDVATALMVQRNEIAVARVRAYSGIRR
jgi:hypothetical protein